MINRKKHTSEIVVTDTLGTHSHNSDIHNLNRQQGFTLVELMISITLGLIITAAVVQVYIVSAKTSVIQTSGSQIIDSNTFGLQGIEKKIKLTNLGMAEVAKGTLTGSGVILTADNLSGITLNGTEIQRRVDTAIASDFDHLFTSDGPATKSTGDTTYLSNTNRSSDQLTIQYRAPQDMTDCEGQQALGPRSVTINAEPAVIDGQIVIERYFLRTDGDTLSLVCDAGRYITETMDNYSEQSPAGAAAITVFSEANIINGFDGVGSIIIPNVDDFQILLGVETDTGIKYVPPSEYIAVTDPNNTANYLLDSPIVSVNIGILARGSVALPGTESGQTTFVILGQDTTLDTDVSTNVIRKVYESAVTLRNSRVI